MASAMLKTIAAFLPESVRHRLWIWQNQGLIQWPPVGRVTPQSLWRLRPISRVYGLDRGQPVDRYYIERFLEANANDIQGRVLEVADNRYTVRFGGNRVTKSDVIHIEAGYPNVTFVADLSKGDGLPDDLFDCIICTQTLPFIFDLNGAAHTLHRILKPGGILLLTLPGITKISSYDIERWGHFWSFTSQSAQRLFSDYFAPPRLTVKTVGNVLSATAFLHGLASHELSQTELEYHDPEYQLIITLRAEKAQQA